MKDLLDRLMKTRNLLIAAAILVVAAIAGVTAMALGSGNKGVQLASSSAFGSKDTKSTGGAPNVKSDYRPGGSSGAPSRTLETKNTTNTNVALNVKPAGGPLDVIAYGPASAPVTIIEYGSFTCPHCAEFHEEVLPKLKSKYFDKGLVRLVFRPFYRNSVDVDAGLFIACLPAERRAAWVNVLFHQQQSWIPWGLRDELEIRKKSQDALAAYADKAGIRGAGFDRCLDNSANKNWLEAVRDQGIKDGLEGTPYFLIGNERKGAMSFEQFQKILDPMVAKAQGRS